LNNKDTEGLYVKCPNCGASYVYLVDKIASGGFFQCQNCAKWLSIPPQPERDRGAMASVAEAKEAAAHVRRSRPMEDFHIKRDLPTMFYHGLYFSLTILASFWIWIYVNWYATLLGGPIGYYVGIAIISFGVVEVVGYMNVFLVQNLWDVYCRRNWMSVLGHGAIMSALLLTALFPATYVLPLLASQPTDVYIPVAVAMIVLYWIMIGAIGRSVAYLFTVDKGESGRSTSVSD